MDITKDEHYAIITTGTIWIPGDERSRTNPGHGYPDHTETTIQYDAFATVDALKLRLRDMSDSERRTVRVIKATPVSVQTEIVLHLT